MRNASGYSIITDPGVGRPMEHDTFTCAHCHAVQFTRGAGNALQVAVIHGDGTVTLRDAGFCRNCFQHICPICMNKSCKSFWAKLDEEERAARGIVP